MKKILIIKQSFRKRPYIITTVKHVIWFVNRRAGSGYPARGIKMPSRDSQNVICFIVVTFIKQLPNGFPSRIAWSMHLSLRLEYFYAFWKSRDIPRAYRSRNLARKTIRYSSNHHKLYAISLIPSSGDWRTYDFLYFFFHVFKQKTCGWCFPWYRLEIMELWNCQCNVPTSNRIEFC